MARYRDDVPRSRFDLDDDEDGDDVQDEAPPVPAPRLRRFRREREGSGGGGGGGGGRGDTMRQVLRDLPSFAKLLGRLAVDPRVSRLDKAIVLAALGYMLMPVDLLPDLPVIGQVDDVYLLALALDRLLNNAGIDTLLDHWDGDPESLEAALAALDRAGSFLPQGIRNLLGQRG
ncbi:MAG TPA: DUF1232 domain-containing protein [Longimicrobiaceae bacterium]|jgi:uncharacterized membrane protein YkvA (DUF1232 family)